MIIMQSVRVWFSKATPVGLVILGVVVGVGGAFGAALFHTLINLMTTLFFGTTGNMGFVSTIETLPSWQRLLIPTAGGLLIGLLFMLIKINEVGGEGVPEVMNALKKRKARIRPIVAPMKILASAITLGSGGSAGREGPIIQIGSAIGSTIAQFVKLGQEHRSLFLSAGAAAGIGGTFGAPAAGVVFTFEVLKQQLTLFRAFVIIIAAVVGPTVMQLITGYEGLRFNIDSVSSLSFKTLLIAFCLGVVAALIALSFGAILRISKTIFTKLSLPHFLQPAVGGFFIGCIGLYMPYIHEPAAYPLMVDLLALASLPIGFLLTLLLVKMIATGITLGSGGSGGIFAPALLLGTIVGSAFGAALVSLDIILTTDIPTLVLIGMGAVFAGAAHAPLTSTFILYEMTKEPLLIPPLIIACFTAFLITKAIGKQNIYTEYNIDLKS